MDSDDYETDEENYDSDKELQVAFQKGLLKPGLNVEVEPDRHFTNDVDGLKQTLEDFKSDLPWIERMDLTVKPLPPPKPLAEQLGEAPDDISGDDVHNDFKREMKFHRQAQATVLLGIPKLNKLRVPTKRPEDYFAAMAKTDFHMKKVREKLLEKQTSIERSEKAKKLRELRKYGKKVQQEVLLKRQKEKKDMMNSLKRYRKGKQDKLDFLEDNKGGKQQEQQQQKKGQVFQPNKKRKTKDQKFGYGGQKKRSKSNTAESASDMKDFKKSKHSSVPRKHVGNKNKKNNRPGRQRRNNMKSKKK